MDGAGRFPPVGNGTDNNIVATAPSGAIFMAYIKITLPVTYI